MKKLLALLLILTICSLSMFSCWKKDKDDSDDGNESGGILDDGSKNPDEESGDGDTPDNIDPDGWTKVDK